MVEFLMAEYGISREEAFGEFPLASALALLPPSIERRGGTPSGPSAEQLAFVRAANALKNAGPPAPSAPAAT